MSKRIWTREIPEDEAIDLSCSSLQSEVVDHRRWAVCERYICEFEGSPTGFVAFTLERPATECQDWSGYPVELTAVVPKEKTITVYERWEG